MGIICKSKKNKVWKIGDELQSTALILYPYVCVLILCSGNYSEKFNKNNEFKLEDNSVVDVEVDCEKKTIYFFINKNQSPYYISDISSSSFPLLFGFSSRFAPIIEIISLFKILPSSSFINPSLECKEIKWVLIFLFY
jgi:hypothetical protein